MRNPSASDRLAAAALTAAAVLVALPAAADDDKQACGDAYHRTQTLRKEGKLRAARDQAVACTRDACAEFVRADCARWLGEIDASQPTVVLAVRDGDGRDRTAVRVLLDGAPWLDAVDASAHPIDPGPHTLRFEADGEAPIEQQVLVREGEKARTIAVTLGPASSIPAPLAPRAPAPVDAAGDDGSIAPWIVGGVGLGTFTVGAVLGLVVVSERSTFDEHCDEARGTCDAEGIDARETGETLGPISTVAMVAGALGVGVAAVWLVTEDDGDAGPTVATGPAVAPGGGGWRVQGSF